MPAPHTRLATLWLLATLVVAVVLACSEESPRHRPGDPPGLGVYVPASWQTTRSLSGHRVHVLGERIACVKCHSMTESSMGAVVPSSCTPCHEKESRIEHAREQARERFGADAKTDCTVCHGFTLDATGHADAAAGHAAPDAGAADVPAATDCGRCHAKPQGETPAVEVHGTSECVKCHRPHEDARPKPGACDGCHADVKSDHAARGKTSIEACAACHTHMHAPASEALGTCTSCHGTEEPVVPATALFEGGHTECVACHRPHDFGKQAAVSCRSCHEDVHVLGAGRVKVHERCENCHSPHDVRGTADRACSTCHESVHPDHPKRGVAGTCAGCHDPHPSGKQAHDKVRACSACHQKAESDKEFHGHVACTQCHAPHDFALEAGERTPCQGCHAREIGLAHQLSGHASCEGCHRGLPHRPDRLGVACSACHEKVHATARPGHGECTQCHEPHGGSITKECRNCHSAEHRTAPAGHRGCTNCHEKHSGSAASAACSTCHADQAASPHGAIAKDCASCHRPHGPEGVPKPPSCSSCHQTAKLPGLHNVVKHQGCMSCHGTHGEVQPAYRGECLSCHADRKDHFPEAPSCASCHLFGPTR